MDVHSSTKLAYELTGRPRPQTSVLNEWADPFPVRQFLDIHMMVRCPAALISSQCCSTSPVLHWELMFDLFAAHMGLHFVVGSPLSGLSCYLDKVHDTSGTAM